jgi:hypothetical protein
LECRSIEFGFRLFDYLHFSKLANDWLNSNCNIDFSQKYKRREIRRSGNVVWQKGRTGAELRNNRGQGVLVSGCVGGTPLTSHSEVDEWTGDEC